MNTKCEQCRILVFREPDREIPALRVVSGGQRLVHVLHYTRESWAQSIASGCHFCTLVRGQVYDSLVSSPVCEALSAFVILAITHRPGSEPEYLCDTLNLRIQIISKLGNSQLSSIEELPDHYRSALNDYILLSQCRSSVVQHRGHSLTSALDVGQTERSLFNVQLARLWRDDCLLNHTQCKRGSNGCKPKLPTRLLDVADPEHPFIQETHFLLQSTPYVQYVALSYCWGQGKRFLALRDNYELFKTAGLPASDLPQTFRDAIHVAHGMGYQYIWIDALCIIQDEPEDLENELRYMGDIYRYAELTICAQGAASSHSGLFQSSRRPLSLAPCSVEFQIASASRENTNLNRTLSGRFNTKDYLGSRGWVLQEELLTLRALKFSDQMSWRCMEAIQMETEPHLSRTFSHPQNSWSSAGTGLAPRIIEDPLKTFRGVLYGDDPSRIYKFDESALSTQWYSEDQKEAIRWSGSPADIFAAWYSVVELYSDKELTVASDVLRALSGLSGIFRDIYRTTYLAGLWKEDLFAGLCWYVSANDTRPVATSGPGGGPNVPITPTNTLRLDFRHTAPSWTWASVGKVRVRFPCLSLRSAYAKCPTKPKDESQDILDVFCSWDDPINQKRPVLSTGCSTEQSLAQLWTLRMKTKVKKAILRRSEIYTQWRTKGQSSAGVSAQYDKFERLRRAPIHPRFPGQLLDFEDRTLALGEAACDSGLEYNLPTVPSLSADDGNSTQLVKWHAISSSVEPRGVDKYQDVEVMCLFLDTYLFWPHWYDLCLLALPRGKGSSSFARIGLGLLPREENHEEELRRGWVEMDCEIF